MREGFACAKNGGNTRRITQLFFLQDNRSPTTVSKPASGNLESVGAVPASQSLNSKAEVTGKEVGAQESQAQDHHH